MRYIVLSYRGLPLIKQIGHLQNHISQHPLYNSCFMYFVTSKPVVKHRHEFICLWDMAVISITEEKNRKVL